jgi:hypothetical protein
MNHQLLIVIVGLCSLVVALVAAMLKMSLKAPPAQAAMSAGAAFAGTFALGLAILAAL